MKLSTLILVVLVLVWLNWQSTTEASHSMRPAWTGGPPDRSIVTTYVAVPTSGPNPWA